MTHNLEARSQHVVWLVESPDAQWHAFRLRGLAAWGLYGCRIERV